MFADAVLQLLPDAGPCALHPPLSTHTIPHAALYSQLQYASCGSTRFPPLPTSRLSPSPARESILLSTVSLMQPRQHLPYQALHGPRPHPQPTRLHQIHSYPSKHVRIQPMRLGPTSRLHKIRPHDQILVAVPAGLRGGAIEPSSDAYDIAASSASSAAAAALTLGSGTKTASDIYAARTCCDAVDEATDI